VSVKPVSHDTSRKVNLFVRYPNGQAFQTTVPDRDLTIGRQKILLSDVQVLFAGAPPRAQTRRGPVLVGAIAGLPKTNPPGKGRPRPISLADAARIDVQPQDPPPDVQAIGALIQLKQGTRVLATVVRRIEMEGVPTAPAPKAIAIRIGNDIYLVPVRPQVQPDPRSRTRQRR
jgi:hypothetical protein